MTGNFPNVTVKELGTIKLDFGMENAAWFILANVFSQQKDIADIADKNVFAGYDYLEKTFRHHGDAVLFN